MCLWYLICPLFLRIYCYTKPQLVDVYPLTVEALIMDCLNYSAVLVLALFTMLLSAKSSNILKDSLKYLAKYNDMNLESIITMCEYGTGGNCEINSEFSDDVLSI